MVQTAVKRRGRPPKAAANGAGAAQTVATAKAPPETQQIELPRLQIQRCQITIVGDSPLIVHKWSDKAKKEMLDKQMKVAKQGRAAKVPEQDFLDSMYFLNTDGTLAKTPSVSSRPNLARCLFGFPVVAFKAAAVDACTHITGITKVSARGSFHIDGEFAVIQGVPHMREDMVRVGMGTADIRYRGEFSQWRTQLTIRYNTNVISVEQIANLFNTAGFAVGIGEWRPQKDGSYGMFHVE